MPGAKIYVVNSLELIAAVQRHHKALAFPPIEAKMGRRMNAWSDEADKIIMKNVNGDEGDWGMSMESYKVMRSALTPGADLDAMNRIMIQNIAASVEKLRPGNISSTTEVNLMQWLRHELTMATTRAIYGPQNPYADCNVENGFWWVSQAVCSVPGLSEMLIMSLGTLSMILRCFSSTLCHQ